MADHADLLRELAEVEKLSTQERLKIAKKRRAQQLKRWSDIEKKADKQDRISTKKKAKASLSVPVRKEQSGKVKFDNGVMFLEAAARNDIKEVRTLLELGVNPDVANEDGLTALHQCCIDDSEEMVLLLLQFNASVNSRDSELWTPLHAAATCGHLRICKHLVEREADLLAVNADGNMPYDICEDEQTLEFIETQMADKGVTQELIDATRLSTEKKMMSDVKEFERDGHSPSSWRDRTGATLLHVSAANGYYEVVSYLLTKQFDINVTDNDGWTPAHAAACWGQVAVLELLAKSGADFELKTKNNETLLDLVEDAEMKQQIETIKKEVKSNLEKFRRENDTRRRSSHNIRSHVSSMYSSNTSLSDKTTFSSSVRRHSMREKHKMSVKEARDEARFRINAEQDQPAPSQEQSHEVPVTNIDDVEMSVTENVTTIKLTDDKKDALNEAQAPLLLTANVHEQVADVRVSHELPKPVDPKPKKVSAVIHVSDLNTGGQNEARIHYTQNAPSATIHNGADAAGTSKFIAHNTSPTLTQKLPSNGKAINGTAEGDRLPHKPHEPMAPANRASQLQSNEPVKRYTSRSEVVGKEDKHSCCIIV